MPVSHLSKWKYRKQSTGTPLRPFVDESAGSNLSWKTQGLNGNKVLTDKKRYLVCFKMSKWFSERRDTCILLVQKTGKKRERGIFNTGSSKVEVLPGTLLLLHSTANNIFIFESLDQENIEIECRTDAGEFEPVSLDDCQLLFSIPTCTERLVVFHNKQWLEEGLNLQKGDVVEVQMKGYETDLLGILQYKGKVTDIEGTYFGVELVVIVLTEICSYN